jgi:hypothetical protein
VVLIDGILLVNVELKELIMSNTFEIFVPSTNQFIIVKYGIYQFGSRQTDAFSF